MLEVRILSHGTPIGRAELRAADPPMGVASGEFVPGPAYGRLRPTIDAIARGTGPDWNSLALTVETVDGRPVSAVGGVVIMDWLEPGRTEPPEVEVAGIGEPGEYARWFGDDPAYRAYYAT